MATENNAPLSLDKTAVKRMERPHWVLDDAVYSISALLLSVIVMHSIWTLIIRPRAEAVLSQRVTITNSSNVKAQVIQLRSVYVILKDHEQELCVILCMWSLLLLARQAYITQNDRKLLDKRLREDRRSPGCPARRCASVFTAARGAAARGTGRFPAAAAHGRVQPFRRDT